MKSKGGLDMQQQAIEFRYDIWENIDCTARYGIHKEGYKKMKRQASTEKRERAPALDKTQSTL